MKIQDIHIRNFRGIGDLYLSDLDSKVNIIVGINGAGKTSILESVAMLLSWFIARMKSPNAKGSTPLDADIKSGSRTPCSLSITTEDGTTWSLHKHKAFSTQKRQNADKTDLKQMSELAEKIVERAGQSGNVPIVMYYPVNRAIADVPVKLHKAEYVIWDVYKDALSGNADFRSFFEWYRQQEDIENEQIRDNPEYRDRNLDAVRRAVAAFFPDFSELRVRRRPYQAMVVNKNDEVIEFTQLSQGEKCYLSLVCDIARRLAIANPGLENPLDGEGIILIDEIDLHLHPKWQSEVVMKLTEIFKNCQFFLSTHSALILSDVRKSQIIPIDRGNKIEIAFETYGKPASLIMTDYFDMPNQRNLAVAKDIEEAFEAVREGNSEKYTTLRSKLLPIIGASDRDMVNLMIEAKRRGIDETNR